MMRCATSNSTCSIPDRRTRVARTSGPRVRSNTLLTSSARNRANRFSRSPSARPRKSTRARSIRSAPPISCIGVLFTTWNSRHRMLCRRAASFRAFSSAVVSRIPSQLNPIPIFPRAFPACNCSNTHMRCCAAVNGIGLAFLDRPCSIDAVRAGALASPLLDLTADCNCHRRRISGPDRHIADRPLFSFCRIRPCCLQRVSISG